MTTVRRGDPGDLPALHTIQRATLDEPWPALLEPAAQGAATLLVAEADGEVVGYAVAVGAAGEPAYVPELAVASGHQRQGHGSALLTELLDRLAAAHPEVRLTVRVDDERARSFYRTHGFEEWRRLPDEFDAGDGLLLSRDLVGEGSGTSRP